MFRRLLQPPSPTSLTSGPRAAFKTDSNETSSSGDPPSPPDDPVGPTKPSAESRTSLPSPGPVKPLTPILNTGNKERRQGRVQTVSITENISSPIKNLTLDITASETHR